MNAIRNTSAALLLSSLAFTALPAGAVSFDSGPYNADRQNTAGTTTTIGPPHANHFCYLSRVGLRDIDNGSEIATCQVRRSGTVWILEAILNQNDDHDAFCSMTCYNN